LNLAAQLPWLRLRPGARRALLVHALHWQAVSIGQLYVGVYLFRLSHGYAVPAWHAFWSYFTVPLGSVLGAALTRRWGPGSSLRAGLFVYASFQAVILALGNDAVTWAGCLGAWWGIGVGLYWQAWTLSMMDLTTEHGDRDTMMGGNQAVYFVANLTAAPLAGYFLASFPGTQGYPWAFGMSLLIFAVAAWLSLSLEGKAHPGSSAVWRLLKARKPTGWASCMVSAVLMGVMTVGTLFLPMILAYEVGKGEGLGGLFALASALLGLGASWAISRLGHPQRRGRFLVGAALAVLCFTLPLALHRNLALVLLYGLGMAVSLSLFNVPLFAAHIRLIESAVHFAHRRADAMFLREIAIAVGRCGASAVVVWGVQDISSRGLTWLLVGVAFTPLLNYLVMRRYLSVR
jgi:YQGE family putative transporter